MTTMSQGNKKITTRKIPATNNNVLRDSSLRETVFLNKIDSLNHMALILQT